MPNRFATRPFHELVSIESPQNAASRGDGRTFADPWAARLGPGAGKLALDPLRTLPQALHRIWQVQQGLPQATIHAIFQSHDGYLWLGTQSSFVRFDGLRFATMNLNASNSPKQSKIWINDIAEDPRHNLWVATGAGLARLAEGETHCYGIADGLPAADIEWVLTDAAGVVWAGAEHAVARLELDPQDEAHPARHSSPRITVYREADGLGAARLRAGCLDREGRLWVGGDGGVILRLDGRRFDSLEIPALAGGNVNAMLAGDDGSLWIGSDDGLIQWSEQRERRFTTADGLAHDCVLCLAPTRGGVWAGGKNGFSRVTRAVDGARHEIDSYRASDGLSQSTVYALFEDREASLWVGTKNGLNQFSDRRTLLYTTAEGLPSNNVGPVLQDSRGQVWVGTLGAGLGRLEGRRFTALTTRDGLPSNTIFALAEFADSLWIGSDAGLVRRREGEPPRTFTEADGLPSNVVRSLCSDRSGALWVGTDLGLVCWREGRFEPPQGKAEVLREPVRALARHGEGVLVAGADGALYRCDHGRLETFDDDRAEFHDIATIFEDAAGRVWLGSHGAGLVLIDSRPMDPSGQRLATFRFTVKQGLHDDDISGIASGADDELWMACTKGIFLARISQLLEVAAGKSDGVVSRPFTPLDSQRTIECQAGVEPSVFRLKDGNIWFATTHGLIVIDPDKLVRRLPPMPVVVEQMAVNGEVENLHQLRPMPPGRTNVSFQYAALSFIAPSRVNYRYMLEGFDKDWVEAGTRREAFYTNLPPGEYRFRVAATIPDGVAAEAARPVAFIIEPHIYQRPWFWPLTSTLALALAVGVGWAGVRLRVRQIRRQMQMVVGERSRIARELHDTLMQGFSGVTMEMQALSVRLPESPERRMLEEIIRDAGICLREARRSVAGLRTVGQVGLAATIADAARQLTETQALRLRLRIEPVAQALSSDAQYNLLRIAQEAITNAVKHANCGAIEVVLESSPRRLTLSVLDDGIGFDTGANGSPGHYGLIGMQERARQIGAQLDIESRPGHGARVTVTLPHNQPVRDTDPAPATPTAPP